MTPYYSDKWVTIYHGDCREILPQLDVKVDLVLTDPPYGIKGEESIITTLKVLKLSYQKCLTMALIMDWRFAHRVCSLLEKHKVGELVWEYGWISGGRCKAKYGVLPTHNIIHLFGDVRRFHFLTGTIIKRDKGLSSPRQCSFANKTGHPYEKPIGLIKLLLNKIDCSTVLDSFLGSGTTTLAAKILGKKCIGIEIEEKYCEIAAKRCCQEVMELV